MADKTLVMKLLEGKGVAYEAIDFPASMRDAEAIAAHLGVPAGQLFKTLVVTRPRGKPLLVMVPAHRQLDLKRLAKVIGEKKLKMASHIEAEKLTGLQVGGISALALINRGFAIYLDASARDYEEIFISAGEKGRDVKVAVGELVRVTGARVVETINREQGTENS